MQEPIQQAHDDDEGKRAYFQARLRETGTLELQAEKGEEIGCFVGGERAPSWMIVELLSLFRLYHAEYHATGLVVESGDNTSPAFLPLPPSSSSHAFSREQVE